MSIVKVAVTGSAGSGKSLAAGFFSELGVQVFDCDQIAREVVEPGMQAYNGIISFFGRSIIQDDSTIDRAGLRKIIAGSRDMRRGLEKIIHPAILNNLFRKIDRAEAAGRSVVVVEIPLLFELGLKDRFDLTIMVAGDEDVLVQRIMDRDNVSKKDAEAVLSIQLSQQKKIAMSDFVLWNRSSKDELKRSVGTLYAKIKKEYLT